MYSTGFKNKQSDTCQVNTPPSKSLASLGAQAACQSIEAHFAILTVHDNHTLGLFCHHKVIDVHELCT